MSKETKDTDGGEGLKVYFNPFAFTVEENNEFIRLGYEVMPIQIPDARPRNET